MPRDRSLAWIDLATLGTVHGGTTGSHTASGAPNPPSDDAWGQYKNKVSGDFKAAEARAGAAKYYSALHGHLDVGKLADNTAGLYFDSAKTAWDATGGQALNALGLLK